MLLFFSLQRIPLNLREPLCLKLASPILRQTMIRLAATSYFSWYNKATGGLLILPYFYIRSIPQGLTSLFQLFGGKDLALSLFPEKSHFCWYHWVQIISFGKRDPISLTSNTSIGILLKA